MDNCSDQCSSFPILHPSCLHAVRIFILAALLSACSDNEQPGTGAPSTTASTEQTNAAVSGDDGPRLSGVADGQSSRPLSPGRRYEIFDSEETLAATWQSLFVDAGLAEAEDMPHFEFGSEQAVVGIFLGEQINRQPEEQRFSIDIREPADAADALVVSITISADCNTPADGTNPSPWLLAPITLPTDMTADTIRFVDVIQFRAPDNCYELLPDPAAILVNAPDDTTVVLEYVPEPDATGTEQYGVEGPRGSGFLSVPSDMTDPIRFERVLPRLNQSFGLFPERNLEARPGNRVIVNTDAPSDLIQGTLSADDFIAYLRTLAGDAAHDCTDASGEGVSTSGESCQVAAFNAGEAFYAASAQTGIDSFLMSGIAADPAGRVFLISFDSNPGGGAQPDAGHISGYLCDRPRADSISIVCDSAPPFPSVDDSSEQTDVPAQPPAGTIAVNEIRRGDIAMLNNMTFNQPRFQVFHEQQALETFYNGLANCPCPQEPLPQIDFNQQTVLFVVDEIRSFGGTTIDIRNVRHQDNLTSVSVSTVVPGNRCGVDGGFSGPFLLASIERQTGPSGEPAAVDFIETVEVRDCE